MGYRVAGASEAQEHGRLFLAVYGGLRRGRQQPELTSALLHPQAASAVDVCGRLRAQARPGAPAQRAHPGPAGSTGYHAGKCARAGNFMTSSAAHLSGVLLGLHL